MSRIIWEHCGNDTFDPSKVTKNSKKLFANKPNGLWASPVGNKYLSWKKWCEAEEFRLDSLNKSFKFRVSNKAKLLWIHGKKDVVPYIEKESSLSDHDFFYEKLNVSKIMEKYDGVCLIHGENYYELHYGLFYAWDVDSICVWNPNVIEII